MSLPTGGTEYRKWDLVRITGGPIRSIVGSAAVVLSCSNNRCTVETMPTDSRSIIRLSIGAACLALVKTEVVSWKCMEVFTGWNPRRRNQ